MQVLAHSGLVLVNEPDETWGRAQFSSENQPVQVTLRSAAVVDASEQSSAIVHPRNLIPPSERRTMHAQARLGWNSLDLEPAHLGEPHLGRFHPSGDHVQDAVQKLRAERGVP